MTAFKRSLFVLLMRLFLCFHSIKIGFRRLKKRISECCRPKYRIDLHIYRVTTDDEYHIPIDVLLAERETIEWSPIDKIIGRRVKRLLIEYIYDGILYAAAFKRSDENESRPLWPIEFVKPYHQEDIFTYQSDEMRADHSFIPYPSDCIAAKKLMSFAIEATRTKRLHESKPIIAAAVHDLSRFASPYGDWYIRSAPYLVNPQEWVYWTSLRTLGPDRLGAGSLSITFLSQVEPSDKVRIDRQWDETSKVH